MYRFMGLATNYAASVAEVEASRAVREREQCYCYAVIARFHESAPCKTASCGRDSNLGSVCGESLSSQTRVHSVRAHVSCDSDGSARTFLEPRHCQSRLRRITSELTRRRESKHPS